MSLRKDEKKELDRLTYFYYVVWIQIYNKQSHQGSSQRYALFRQDLQKDKDQVQVIT